MAGLPTVTVQLDDGTGTYPWDVSSRVRMADGVTISRGRQDEVSEVQASTLTLTLENADGVMSAAPTFTTRTNLVPNPSFETGLQGYWQVSGTLIQASPRSKFGNASGRFTAAASGRPTLNTDPIPVTVGTTYTASVYGNVLTALSQAYRLNIWWYDSSDNLITFASSAGSFAAVTGGWVQISVTASAPAGAVSARVFPLVSAGTSTTADQIFIDGVMFEASASLGSYFDGDTAGGSWTGVPGSSTSIQTVASGPSLFLDQRIQVSETVAGSISVRFTGYVQENPVSWPSGDDTYAVVKVSASDLLTRLSRWKAVSPVAQELAKERVLGHWSLTEAGVQSADDSGNDQPYLTVYGSGPSLSWQQGAAAAIDGLPGVQVQAGAKYLSTYKAGTLTGASWKFDDNSTSTGAFVLAALVQTTDSNGVVAQVSLKSHKGYKFTAALDASGHLRLVSGFWNGPTATIDVTGSIVVNDGNPHVCVWAIAPNGSGNTVTLMVDGTTDTATYAIGSTATASYRPGFEMLEVGGASGINDLLSTRLNTVGIAHLMLSDTTSYLSTYSALLLGYPTDDSDQRLTRYADYVGLPTWQRTFEAGVATSLGTMPVIDGSVVDLMNQVASTEDGLVFVNGTGQLVFQNRNHRATQVSPDLTLSADALSEDTAVTSDLQHVVNFETVTWSGGTATASSASSIASHGQYPSSLELLATSLDAANDRANWDVNTHAEPTPRFASVTIDALTQTQAIQQGLLGLELSDRLTFTGLPAQAPTVLADQVIEGWTETVTTTGWDFTFNTTPWAFEQAWILEDAAYGLLDNTTRLGL